jgi:hypothetical protein
LAVTFDAADVNQIDGLFAGFFGPEVAPEQTLAAIVAADDNIGGNAEVELDRIGPDGVATPVLGIDSASPVHASVSVQADADGNVTQAQLIISPAGTGPVLGPGNYQVNLLPGTALATVFGMLYPTSDWAGTHAIPIAQFTVLGRGVTFGDATRLGTVGPVAQNVSGFVNSQDSTSAVSLYEFMVPQGSLWQLNARVLSQAIGSPLLAGLTLFDAGGDVLAESNAGTGSLANASDPSITKGLGPGTYYVGVSGANDLPGWDGGYDPRTGTPGTAGFDDPDGPFLLQLVADPVVTTTTVLGTELDHADPLEPSPTGLEVTFSGPVDAAPLFEPDRQETALEVVDASGRVWPITAVSYDNATHTLDFVFDEPLPTGGYTLIEPAQGGLTDLSGQALVAPSGNPPGVLASWTVTGATGPVDPNNLGVVWPGPVNVSWNSSISRFTELAAGGDAAYRFVAICPGVYQVQVQVAAGAADLEVTGTGGTPVLVANNLTGLDQPIMQIGTGIYELRLTSVGSQPAAISWTLKPVSLDYEKIIENGVGQAPALTQSLIGTPSAAPDATPGPGASVTATTAAILGGNGEGAVTTTLVASPVPSSLLLVSMETGLMGLPSANAQAVAAVGPMVEGTLASVADRVNGLLPGIRYGSGSESESQLGYGDLPEESGLAIGPPGGKPVQTARAAPAQTETSGAGEDARVLVRVDRLLGLVDWLESRIAPSWIGGGFDTARTPEAAPKAPEVIAQLDEPPLSRRRNRRENRIEADLTLPLGVIVTAAVARRMQRPHRHRSDDKTTAFGGPRRPHLFTRRSPNSPGCHTPTTHFIRMPRTPS